MKWGGWNMEWNEWNMEWSEVWMNEVKWSMDEWMKWNMNGWNVKWICTYDFGTAACREKKIGKVRVSEKF